MRGELMPWRRMPTRPGVGRTGQEEALWHEP